MGYYGRRSYSRQPRENNPELVTRIEKTAARGTSSLSDWERSFMGSLLDSAKKWGRLTAKQHEVFQRIEKKTDVYEPIEGNLCWCLRHSRTSRAQPKVPVNTRYFPSAQTNRLIPKNASLKNNNKLFTM